MTWLLLASQRTPVQLQQSGPDQEESLPERSVSDCLKVRRASRSVDMHLGLAADPKPGVLRRKMRTRKEKKKLGLSLRSILELMFVCLLVSFIKNVYIDVETQTY